VPPPLFLIVFSDSNCTSFNELLVLLSFLVYLCLYPY
jgi:hypothetical protein